MTLFKHMTNHRCHLTSNKKVNNSKRKMATV